MDRSIGDAVEGFAGIEADRSGTLAAKVDNLLQTGSAGSTRDQDPVQRASATQGFPYRMDADQKCGAAGFFGRSLQCRASFC